MSQSSLTISHDLLFLAFIGLREVSYNENVWLSMYELSDAKEIPLFEKYNGGSEEGK